MAGKRDIQKRKQSWSTGARGKRQTARKPQAVVKGLLKASRDATRKQDLGKTSAEMQLQRPNGGMARSPGLDVVGLLNRRTKAVLELPTLIARCHSPFEVWGVQARFIQEGFTDYADHVMTNIVRGLERTTRP